MIFVIIIVVIVCLGFVLLLNGSYGLLDGGYRTTAIMTTAAEDKIDDISNYFLKHTKTKYIFTPELDFCETLYNELKEYKRYDSRLSDELIDDAMLGIVEATVYCFSHGMSLQLDEPYVEEDLLILPESIEVAYPTTNDTKNTNNYEENIKNISGGGFISCEGAFNLIISVKVNDALYVLRVNRNKINRSDEENAAIVKSINTNKKVVKAFKGCRYFPNILCGSHSIFHSKSDGVFVPVLWSIVKKYRPIDAEFVKQRVDEYATAVLRILQIAHKNDLCIIDWKIYNFAYDDKNRCFVLIDWDMIDVNDNIVAISQNYADLAAAVGYTRADEARLGNEWIDNITAIRDIICVLSIDMTEKMNASNTDNAIYTSKLHHNIGETALNVLIKQKGKIKNTSVRAWIERILKRKIW